MAQPSLQLDVESALRSFLALQNISGYSFQNIYRAHAREKIDPDTKGTYLGIIADTPDWEMLVVNAIIKVTFEVVSAGMQDHEAAPRNSADHAQRSGQIVQLFSQQAFTDTLAGLNNSASAFQLGFTGFEAQKPEPDGTSQDGTQLITRLSYIFEVYLGS